MTKRIPGLDDAISELANLWPLDGELEASANPVAFVRRVTAEVGRLRAESADLSRALRESLAHAQDLSREVRHRVAERDRARDYLRRELVAPRSDRLQAALADEEVEP